MIARSGEVERGVSVLGQAPLGGSKAPPSPLGFKLMLVVPGRIESVVFLSMFRARHSGVSNPSLCPGYRGFGLVKATFVVGFQTIGCVSQPCGRSALVAGLPNHSLRR